MRKIIPTPNAISLSAKIYLNRLVLSRLKNADLAQSITLLYLLADQRWIIWFDIFMTTSTLSSSIARDLLNSISLINSLLNEIESDPLKSMEDQIAFSKVATTLKILYSKSNRHFESSPEAHREAFQKKFTFPSRFKEPATLAVIMSFIYTMIISYEHHCMSPMLTDADHIMYAQRLSKTHKREIAGLLIKK